MVCKLMFSLQMADDKSSSSLELSCDSSDFDPEPTSDLMQPYLFEPEVSEDEEEGGPEVHDAEDLDLTRLMSTDWCLCQNCCAMGSLRESRCCKECPEMEVMTSSAGVLCITDHPGFKSVCLDKYVLETCYCWYNQQYGRAIQGANERYRYTAYRMLVRFVWKWLGKDIRVTLPACAVSRIRKEFPSADGCYTGYMDLE